METKYELINQRPVSELENSYRGSVYYLSDKGEIRQPTELLPEGLIRNKSSNPSQLWGAGWKAKEPEVIKITINKNFKETEAPQAPAPAPHLPHWVDDRPPTVEEVGDDDWVPVIMDHKLRDADGGSAIRDYWAEGTFLPWLANIPPYVKAERFKVVECPSLSKPNKFAVRDIKKTAVFYEAVGIPTREAAEAIKAIYEKGAV